MIKHGNCAETVVMVTVLFLQNINNSNHKSFPQHFFLNIFFYYYSQGKRITKKIYILIKVTLFQKYNSQALVFYLIFHLIFFSTFLYYSYYYYSLLFFTNLYYSSHQQLIFLLLSLTSHA